MSTQSEIHRGPDVDKILRNFADVKEQKKVYHSKCIFRIVDYNSLKQGCGTVKFQARTLAPAPDI